MKTCACCGIGKRKSKFYMIIKANKSVLHSYCKDCCKIKRGEVTKEKKLAYQKKYRNKHKIELKQKNILYLRNNPLKRAETLKRYRKKNRKLINLKKKISFKNNYKNNLRFKMECLLRARLGSLIRLGYAAKKESIIKLIGCNVEELIKHIERQFKDGMSWKNHGEWHIDHIIPCSFFDLTKLSEQRKCFNFKNLQPLWKEENLKKSDNILIDNISP